MIRRPPRDTHCRSSAASDVDKRQSSLEEEEDNDDEGKDVEEEEEEDDTDRGSPSSNLTKYSPTRLAPTAASASTKPPHGSRGLSPHCKWVSVAASVAAATSPAEGGE